MLEAPYRTSPFGPRTGPAFELSCAGLAIAERPFLGRLLLRGPTDDDRFGAVVCELLGLGSLPRPPKLASAGDVSLLGLGPDEWLAICRPDQPQAVLPKLRERLQGIDAMAVDVSCAFATLRLTGARSFELLRKGCSAPVDRLAVGDCIRTRVGRHNILVSCCAEGPALDLHVARSYARSFRAWLTDAAWEWSGE